MTQRLDPLEIVNTPPPEEDPRPTGMVTQANPNVNFNTLQQARLAGNDTFSVGEDVQKNIQQSRQRLNDEEGFMFGIGEDQREVYSDDPFVTTPFGVQRAAGPQGRLLEAQDAQTTNMLRAQGLEPVYQIDKYRRYVYDINEGDYRYEDNTPSMFDQALPALIKAGVIGTATGGLGGALSSGLGVSTGVGKAIASTGLNAMFGEDIDLNNTLKNVAMSYGMDKLGDLTETFNTGNDFTDSLLKDTVGSVAQGKDPKEAVLKSLLKQGGDYVADALNLGEAEDSFLATLSDIDKEYLQPVKDYVEEALGVDFSEAYDEIKDDVDGFLDKVPDQVKDLLEGFAKFKLGEAIGIPQGGATGSTGSTGYEEDPLDLVTVTLDNPELVRGFDLSNPFLR